MNGNMISIMGREVERIEYKGEPVEWVDDFIEKFEVRNRIEEAAEEMLGEWESEKWEVRNEK